MPYLGETLSVGAAAFWAVGVVLFKKSGETTPPLALNFIKTMVAIAFLIPTVELAGGDLLPAQPASVWLMLLLSGIVGISLADTLFFIALEKLGAGLMAVVDTSYAPIMIALSFAFLGESAGPTLLFGTVLIVLSLLVGSNARPEPGKSRRDISEGIAIGLAGIALMAIGIVMVKEILNRTPIIWATFVRILGGFVGLIPIMLASPRRRLLFSALRPSRSWRYVLPAAFVGSYLVMMFWKGGMKYVKVSVAAPLNQLSTIFIFILAIVFLKEPVTWRRVLAICLAFPGAVLVVMN